MFGKKKNEDYSVKTVKVGIDKLTTIALGTMVKGAITVEGFAFRWNNRRKCFL